MPGILNRIPWVVALEHRAILNISNPTQFQWARLECIEKEKTRITLRIKSAHCEKRQENATQGWFKAEQERNRRGFNFNFDFTLNNSVQNVYLERTKVLTEQTDVVSLHTNLVWWKTEISRALVHPIIECAFTSADVQFGLVPTYDATGAGGTKRPPGEYGNYVKLT